MLGQIKTQCKFKHSWIQANSQNHDWTTEAPGEFDAHYKICKG